MSSRRRWRATVLLVAAVSGAAPLLLSGSMPGRDLPAAREGTDPLAQCAQLAQALRHAPWDGELLQAPWFWPTAFAQTFLDPMIAPSVVARVVPNAAERPAAAYQFVLWFSLAGAVVATTALARRFGLERPAALLAGVVYALGPASAWHWHHLNQAHAPWLPLAILAADHLLRGRRPLVALLAVAALVTVQLFWSVYGTASMLLALAVFCLVRGWDEPVRAPWIGVAVLAVVAIVIVGSQPFRLAADAVEGFARDPSQTLYFQARWSDFLRAPASHLLPWPPAQSERAALYPGLGWSALAIVGSVTAWKRRERASLALGAAAIVALLFAFGRSISVPGTSISVPTLFALVQDHFEPLQAIRVPARLVVVTALGLALLGARGATELWRRVPSRPVVFVVLALALLDLAPGPLGRVRAALDAEERALARALAGTPERMPWIGWPPPCDEPQESVVQARFMSIALASGRPYADGASGFVPPFTRDLRTICCDGLEDRCLERLRGSGIAWIVAPRGELEGHIAVDVVWSGERWELGSLVIGGGGYAPLPDDDLRR